MTIVIPARDKNGLIPHYATEMHLHNLTNENQTLTLKNIFPIG